jgi:hypothetical protein
MRLECCGRSAVGQSQTYRSGSPRSTNASPIGLVGRPGCLNSLVTGSPDRSMMLSAGVGTASRWKSARRGSRCVEDAGSRGPGNSAAVASSWSRGRCISQGGFGGGVVAGSIVESGAVAFLGAVAASCPGNAHAEQPSAFDWGSTAHQQPRHLPSKQLGL